MQRSSREAAAASFTVLALSSAVPARAAPVALVHDESRQDKRVEEQFAGMKKVLREAGYQYTVVTGREIEDGRLSRELCDVAVLPYCPGLSVEARGRLGVFCADGGRAVVFYDTTGREHGSNGFVLFDYHESGAPLPYLSGLRRGPLRTRARTPWGR